MFEFFKNFWSRTYQIPVDREDWVAPEETLVDSGSRYADLEQPITPTVFRVLSGVIVVSLILIVGFIVKLSVVQRAAYVDLSFKNKTVNFAVTPPRGLILDRTGKPLVRNVPSLDLLAVSREARRELRRTRPSWTIWPPSSVAQRRMCEAHWKRASRRVRCSLLSQI